MPVAYLIVMERECGQLELNVVCVERKPEQLLSQLIHRESEPWKVHRPDDVDIDLHDVDDKDVRAIAGDRQTPHRDHVAVRLLSFSM